MNIKLTPDQVRIIEDEASSGHFRSAEEVIAGALDALREKERSTNSATNGAQAEAVRAMLAFAEENHVRLDGVSVRELIHEGHRL